MIVKNADVNIFTQSFGDKHNEPILLIMGATASMLWWDDAFCTQLADRGFFVIRYDNRDTGESTSYPPGEIHYNIMDMKRDALAILEQYNLPRANLIGMSLGGMIAQILAVENPEVVKTLTLISSSPFDANEELPGIDQKVMDHFSNSVHVDWADQSSVIEYMLGGLKIQTGTRHPFHEQKARDLITKDYERAEDIRSSYNHALLSGGEDLYGTFLSIKKPVLIIHGTRDPVLPFSHAQKLHQIENSELLTLENSGHEIHENDWGLILSKIESFIKEAPSK